MSKKINGIQDLQAYREQLQAADGTTEIRVAMATCAIATGAKAVLDTIEGLVGDNNLNNVSVKKTGCMGYCYAEPTVEVVRPGEEPVMYGPVDEQTARDIVLKHAMNGEQAGNVLKTCHVNA